LLARLTSANPASLRTFAYPGGERNWKHVLPAVAAEHLPTPVSLVSGCSRLAICRSAPSAACTSAKKPLPLLGGRLFGASPMMTSPTPDIEICSVAAGAEGEDWTLGPADAGPAAAAGYHRLEVCAAALARTTATPTTAIASTSTITAAARVPGPIRERRGGAGRPAAGRA
jgi:hypothetical protein